MANFKIDTVFALDINNYNQYLLKRLYKHSFLYKNQDFYVSCVSNNFMNFVPLQNNIYYFPYNKEFSLSCQKNHAAQQCTGEYLLLSDPDFFSYSSFYRNMEKIINGYKSAKKTPFFIFPAYHANKIWSEKIFLSPKASFDTELISFFLTSCTDNTFYNCLFIAPYSNVILLSKKLFYYIGGYNESFKGFGSEDFEFMIRALITLDVSPKSKNMNLDIYQPATKHFFRCYRKFIGFRRFLELYTFPLECMDGKFVHLHHEKVMNKWYKNKDKNRTCFNEQVLPYINDNSLILNYDWIVHRHKAICMLTDKNNWRLFLILRCNDYATIRYEINREITIDICKELSNKYNTTVFAFDEDFCKKNVNLISAICNNGFIVLKVEKDGMEQYNIYNLAIDNISYSCTRTNIQRCNFWEILFNIFYDYIYIFKNILNNKFKVIKNFKSILKLNILLNKFNLYIKKLL